MLCESVAKRKRARSVRGGRKGALLNAGEKLFLFYIKVYPTFDVAAFLFSVTKSRPIDWVKSFMPLLEQSLGRTIVMPQRQINSIPFFYQHFPEVKNLFIDGTERRVQSPSTAKRQKKTHSGKKKTHTRKNMFVCDDKKRILFLSSTKDGRMHDLTQLKKSNLLEVIPKHVTLWGDKGYQKIHQE